MTIYKLKKASNLMLSQWFDFQTLKFAKSKTQWGERDDIITRFGATL